MKNECKRRWGLDGGKKKKDKEPNQEAEADYAATRIELIF